MRSRLIALMLIPTLFGVIMTGLSVYDSARSAAAYQQVEHLAKMSNVLAKLTHELEYERDLAAGYIATAPDPAHRNEGMLERLRGQYATVDSARDDFRKLAAEVDTGYSSVVQERVRNALKRLDDLASLRTITTDTLMPALPAVTRYSDSISDLHALMDEVAQGASDPRLGEMVRAHTALTRAKDQASKQRGVLFMALLNHKFSAGELEALTKARAEYESALAAFRTAATVEQRQRYEDTVSGADIDKSETLRMRALALVEQGATQLTVEPGGRSDAAVWLDSMNATVDRMRSVEVEVGKDVQERAATLLGAEQRAAYLEAAAALLVLALVLLITVVVGRSMVRPLHRLRDGALQVAEARLPDAVRRLRESEGEAPVPDVEPIDIDSSDEIGEVARAFDEVHREALRLAADEAMLRSNVNAMFVNLSRRSQTLIERQLKLISGLEQSEQEPDALDSLFKLDHLATRMRRNCENLLVLSGQEVTRRWSRPVPLVDVLRASLSEVEQYERVQVQAQAGMSVVGRAVNDLVHLTAELVENATAFSPQSSKIVVAAQSIASGAVMLEITDSGIGMSQADLADANWRLANPPVVDVSVSRRMGLFVVGRLASRHGIQVQLRPAQTGGLTALVVLPVQLLADASGTELAPPPVEEPARDRLALTGAPAGAPAQGSMPGRPAAVRDTLGGNAALPPGPPAPPPPPVVPEWAPPEHDDDQVVVESVVEDSPRLPRRQSGSAKAAAEASKAYESQAYQPQSYQPQAYQEQAYHEQAYQERPPVAPPGAQPPAAQPYESRPYQPQPYEAQPYEAAPHETAPMPRLQGDPRQGPTTAGRTVRTAGQPTVVPPARTGPSERLPIFDSVESDWFRRDPLPDPGQDSDDSAPSGAWSSPSDYGWQAAESVAEPESSGTTDAGLPRRVPRANLVPGSARQPLGRPVGGGGGGSDNGGAQPPSGGTPLRSAPPARSADRVRSRFSSLQKGARDGRAAARSGQGEDVERTRKGTGSVTEQENE